MANFWRHLNSIRCKVKQKFIWKIKYVRGKGKDLEHTEGLASEQEYWGKWQSLPEAAMKKACGRSWGDASRTSC